MMLAPHELARIFFAGESGEARVVPAAAFDGCGRLGAASIAIGVFMAYIGDTANLLTPWCATPVTITALQLWSPSIPIRTSW